MSNTIEQRFEELVTGLTRKVDFEWWPDSIFFFRDEECLFEYELNFSYLWFHREKVCRVLECGGQYSPQEIESFIKEAMGKHFKAMGLIFSAHTFESMDGVDYSFQIKKPKQ